MVPRSIGVIEALWRYPVKSMQGEQLSQSVVSERGIVGDRAYAIVDQATGHIASAKYPRKWAQLIACQAAFVEPPVDGAPLPPVSITLPHGTRINSLWPGVHQALSEVFGRKVRLVQIASHDYLRETDRTPIDTPAEVTITEEPIGLASPEGTFFDVAPLHLITADTLAHLRAIYPEGQWDVRRFRPNIVVSAHDRSEAFVEQSWLNRTLKLGDGVTLRTIDPTPRCVVTTLEQGSLTSDPGILRALAKNTKSTSITLAPGAVFSGVAGIYAQVRQAGIIASGNVVQYAMDKPGD